MAEDDSAGRSMTTEKNCSEASTRKAPPRRVAAKETAAREARARLRAPAKPTCSYTEFNAVDNSINAGMRPGNRVTVRDLAAHDAEIIKAEQPSLIIGNSLGGFFALMCESGNIPILSVNPCVNPYEHMKRYVDQTLEYHSKRNDGSTTYLFTQETLEKFKEYNYIKDKIKANMDNIWALLSTRDEVLGDTHIKLFEEVEKETGYDHVLYFTNGFFGHRFTYSNIIVLCEFIDEIMSERN